MEGTYGAAIVELQVSQDMSLFVMAQVMSHDVI
jgi:hypothetical protein